MARASRIWESEATYVPFRSLSRWQQSKLSAKAFRCGSPKCDLVPVDRSGSHETISRSSCCQFCHVVTDDLGQFAPSGNKSIAHPNGDGLYPRPAKISGLKSIADCCLRNAGRRRHAVTLTRQHCPSPLRKYENNFALHFWQRRGPYQQP
jgi:hypothetical protein